LLIDFIGNERGIIIFNSRGCPGVNIDNINKMVSSTNSLVLNPKIKDIMSRISLPVSINQECI